MQPPQWTSKISDSVLCGYYYVFFLIFSVLAGIAFLGGGWVFATTKMSAGMFIGSLFNIILSFGIAGTNALFLYLICNRSLKPKAGFVDAAEEDDEEDRTGL